MSGVEYLDCRLHLLAPARARLEIMGHKYDGVPTFDDSTHRRLLAAATNAREYGSILFQALLPEGELRDGYRYALTVAADPEKRLRFRLDIPATSPELHHYQWEYLFDPERGAAVACSPDTVFSRYLNTISPDPVAIIGLPRLLLVVPDPINLPDYGLDTNVIRTARRSIGSSLDEHRHHFAYEVLDGPATPARIHDKLTLGRFHVLHLQTHGLLSGESTAGLVLETEEREVAIVKEEQLAQIFEGNRDLRLVVLIACQSGDRSDRSNPFSGLGPRLVQQKIPAVLTMQRQISAETASVFNTAFYGNLASSRRIDDAANKARKQLLLTSSTGVWGWGAPALYMRLKNGFLHSRVPTGPLYVDRAPSRFAWDGILNSLEDDGLLPFLGPGVARQLLPSTKQIAEEWASRYSYPLSGAITLPRVAQYLHTNVAKQIPHRSLHRMILLYLKEKIISAGQGPPPRHATDIYKKALQVVEDDPQMILAGLPISNYLTTNYDGLMAAALDLRRRSPRREGCAWKKDLHDLQSIGEYDDLEGTPESPLVFHLFGNEQDPASQVLTQDDHLDFLGEIARKRDCIPSYLWGRMSEALLLFLGYRVTDLNCRVLFRGLVARLKEQGRDRVAVLQIDGFEDSGGLKEELEQFIQKYCGSLSIQVYSGSVSDFLVELRTLWEEESVRFEEQ